MHGARMASVLLLAGNRDINKLRLVRELDGAPPIEAPDEIAHGPRAALLRWILASTMGAKEAFAHRATELVAEARAAGDDDVVQSFLDDLAPEGELRRYLEACQLAFVAEGTLFVHGAVTGESFGVVPGARARASTLDAWVRALNDFYAEELQAFGAGREPSALIAYQAPLSGTRANQTSVVYGRLTDAHANPRLPEEHVVQALRAAEVRRLVVGHTPSGDCPALLREDDFELVLADNSYGRVETGSGLWLAADAITVRGATCLDDGREAEVAFAHARSDTRSPLGLRDAATGQLVKGRLSSGELLLFRGLPGYRVEQTAASLDDVRSRALEPAR